MRNSTRIVLGLSLLSLAIAGGSVSATYAWYQLSADKSIEINGTSFGRSTDLQIGFVSDVELNSDSLSYDAENSLLEGKDIYWNNDEAISSDVVSYVLNETGYSDGDVFPITSGKFDKGDDFNLYQPPLNMVSFENLHRDAESQQYIHLELAFKTSGGYSTVSDVTEGTNIYLSSFKIAGTAKSAIRVRLSSDNIDNAIIDPTATEDGYTLVGGPLDLDQDGEYDYDETTKKEFYYGQNDENLTYGNAYSKDITTTNRNYDCFDNPNQTAGVIPLNNLDQVSAKANYETIDNYIYTGIEEGIPAMCVTDENGIGFLNFDIYLEGWDTSLINNLIGTTVGTAIEFSIGEN